MFNVTIVVEHRLTLLLREFFGRGLIVNIESYKKEIVESGCRHWKKKSDDMMQEINNHTGGDDVGWFASPVLFYYGRKTTGFLKTAFRKYTGEFENKGLLLERLEEFVDLRNEFIHQLISSRSGIQEEIPRAIELGLEIVRLTKKI